MADISEGWIVLGCLAVGFEHISFIVRRPEVMFAVPRPDMAVFNLVRD